MTEAAKEKLPPSLLVGLIKAPLPVPPPSLAAAAARAEGKKIVLVRATTVRTGGENEGGHSTVLHFL